MAQGNPSPTSKPPMSKQPTYIYTHMYVYLHICIFICFPNWWSCISYLLARKQKVRHQEGSRNEEVSSSKGLPRAEVTMTPRTLTSTSYQPPSFGEKWLWLGVPQRILAGLTPHSFQPWFFSKIGCFLWVFDGFLKRWIPGKNEEGSPRSMGKLEHHCLVPQGSP